MNKKILVLIAIVLLVVSVFLTVVNAGPAGEIYSVNVVGYVTQQTQTQSSQQKQNTAFTPGPNPATSAGTPAVLELSISSVTPQNTEDLSFAVYKNGVKQDLMDSNGELGPYEAPLMNGGLWRRNVFFPTGVAAGDNLELEITNHGAGTVTLTYSAQIYTSAEYLNNLNFYAPSMCTTAGGTSCTWTATVGGTGGTIGELYSAVFYIAEAVAAGTSQAVLTNMRTGDSITSILSPIAGTGFYKTVLQGSLPVAVNDILELELTALSGSLTVRPGAYIYGPHTVAATNTGTQIITSGGETGGDTIFATTPAPFNYIDLQSLYNPSKMQISGTCNPDDGVSMCLLTFRVTDASGNLLISQAQVNPGASVVNMFTEPANGDLEGLAGEPVQVQARVEFPSDVTGSFVMTDFKLWLQDSEQALWPVVQVNQPPVANAGLTGYAFIGYDMTAGPDGSGSYDPDGDPLTYAWTCKDGAVSLGTSARATPTWDVWKNCCAVTPCNIDDVFTMNLVVTSTGGTATDSVIAHVKELPFASTASNVVLNEFSPGVLSGSNTIHGGVVNPTSKFVNGPVTNYLVTPMIGRCDLTGANVAVDPTGKVTVSGSSGTCEYNMWGVGTEETIYVGIAAWIKAFYDQQTWPTSNNFRAKNFSDATLSYSASSDRIPVNDLSFTCVPNPVLPNEPLHQTCQVTSFSFEGNKLGNSLVPASGADLAFVWENKQFKVSSGALSNVVKEMPDPDGFAGITSANMVITNADAYANGVPMEYSGLAAIASSTLVSGEDDFCGATLTTSYTFTGNKDCTGFPPTTIGANNVVIDGAGYKITADGTVFTATGRTGFVVKDLEIDDDPVEPGAVLIIEGSYCSVQNSRIIGSDTAIFSTNSNLVVTGTTFSGVVNGISADGGSVEVLNCVADDGFAMPHADPTWATASNAVVSIQNSRISGYGTAIAAENSDVALTNNTFSDDDILFDIIVEHRNHLIDGSRNAVQVNKGIGSVTGDENTTISFTDSTFTGIGPLVSGLEITGVGHASFNGVTFNNFDTGITATDSELNVTNSDFTDVTLGISDVDKIKTNQGQGRAEFSIVNFNGNGAGTAMSFDGKSNVLLDGVTINAYDTGIDVMNSDSVSVNIISGSNLQNAISLTGVGTSQVRNFHLSNIAGAAFTIFEGTSLTVGDAADLASSVTNAGVVFDISDVQTSSIRKVNADTCDAFAQLDSGTLVADSVNVNNCFAGFNIIGDSSVTLSNSLINANSVGIQDYEGISLSVDNTDINVVGGDAINTVGVGSTAVSNSDLHASNCIVSENGPVTLATVTCLASGSTVGIDLTNADGSSITDTTVNGFFDWCYKLSETDGSTILRAEGIGCNVGLEISADSTGNTITDSVFGDNTQNDIINQGSNTFSDITCDAAIGATCDAPYSPSFADFTQVDLHIVDKGNTNHKCLALIGKDAASCKVPLAGIVVKVFDRAVVGEVSKDSAGAVYEAGTGLLSSCTTNAEGNCYAYESFKGNFVVIAKWVNPDTNSAIYVRSPKDSSDFIDTNGDGITDTAFKSLQFLYTLDGGNKNTKPAAKASIKGSNLDVIFPDPWIANSYYEVIVDSSPNGGVWENVQVDLEPPTGFVANPDPVVFGTVDNEQKWSQSYITEVGSDPSDPFVLKITTTEQAKNAITGAAVAGGKVKKEAYAVVEGKGPAAKDKALSKANELNGQGKNVFLNGKQHGKTNNPGNKLTGNVVYQQSSSPKKKFIPITDWFG